MHIHDILYTIIAIQILFKQQQQYTGKIIWASVDASCEYETDWS